MKIRKSILALLVCLVLSLLLSLSSISSVYASPSLEDFTEYTEVDPNSHITFNATAVNASLEAIEDAYLYADYGAGSFPGDFTFKYDIYCAAVSGSGAVSGVWALSNTVDDLKSLEDTNKNFLAAYYLEGATDRFYIKESYGSGEYTDYLTIAIATWWYLWLNRTGTTFTCGIYSTAVLRDAGGTPDVDTLTISLQAAVSYQYLFAAISWHGIDNDYFTTRAKNLDLQKTYEYAFHGPYSETTGYPIGSPCTVYVYFESGASATSFSVQGTKTWKTDDKPQYFKFDLGPTDRQYWVGTTEDAADIYIFNATLTEYTVQFVDLSGVLDAYSFVGFSRIINGTSRTMEKRESDINDKVVVNLIQGVRYHVVIQDAITWDFGEEYFGEDTSPEIILRSINFPQTVILAYTKVRMYAERHNNFTSISLLYEDMESNTDHVDCRIKYRNGTIVYSNTLYSDVFNDTWTSALYNTTYYVEMDASHNEYGEINYRATLYAGGFGTFWDFSWLGSITNLSLGGLLPAALIFSGAALFSKVNAYMGAFIATILAIFFTILGWISISPAMLILALVFTILLAISYKKKEVIGY